jgi:hypothetical protein
MTEREHPAVVAHRRYRRVRVVKAAPCACDGDRVCGFHYSSLSPDQQRAAGERAGIRTYGRPAIGR